MKTVEDVERELTHEINDLKSRYRRIFALEISPLLDDARSSLVIPAAGPAFAEDYMAIIAGIISKELAFLN